MVVDDSTRPTRYAALRSVWRGAQAAVRTSTRNRHERLREGPVLLDGVLQDVARGGDDEQAEVIGYRSVVVSDTQVTFLEELGYAFMRAGDNETATILLGMVLVWRVAPDGEPLPTNVVDINQWSGRVEI